MSDDDTSTRKTIVLIGHYMPDRIELALLVHAILDGTLDDIPLPPSLYIDNMREVPPMVIDIGRTDSPWGSSILEATELLLRKELAEPELPRRHPLSANKKQNWKELRRRHERRQKTSKSFQRARRW